MLHRERDVWIWLASRPCWEESLPQSFRSGSGPPLCSRRGGLLRIRRHPFNAHHFPNPAFPGKVHSFCAGFLSISLEGRRASILRKLEFFLWVLNFPLDFSISVLGFFLLDFVFFDIYTHYEIKGYFVSFSTGLKSHFWPKFSTHDP